MKRLFWLGACGGFLLGGCGGITDGGPVGTGITSSIVGNVVAVQDPAPILSLENVAAQSSAGDAPELAAVTRIQGIAVSLVERPEIANSTDADGAFHLEGDFSGAVTLRFETDGLEVDQSLDVPSGGVTVLLDIELDESGLQAEAGQQLELFAKVRDVDCAGALVVVEDRGGSIFEIALLDETVIRRDGRPEEAVSCSAIRRGISIRSRGFLDELDGNLLEATFLTLGASPNDTPPAEELIGLVGKLAIIDCRAGSVVIDDRRHRVRIRLLEDTRIESEAGLNLLCEDLVLGSSARGVGILNLAKPGPLDGLRLVIGEGPTPDDTLRIRGFVAEKDCAASVLQIALGEASLALRVTPQTRIEPRIGCARIPLGASVRGVGVPSTVLPGGFDALTLNFTRVKDRD